MSFPFLAYRIGALGVLLTLGVFFEEPLASSLRQNPSSWVSVSILFGFAVLVGIFLLSVRPDQLIKGNGNLMFLSHGFALIAVLWLLLWCFDWLAMMMGMGDKAEMYIKHTSYLHLFGVSFSMAGYATGWMAIHRGERAARFLMTAGWAVSYMAWFNLFLEPALKWLWAPALGGLLAAIGAFWMGHKIKRDYETASAGA